MLSTIPPEIIYLIATYLPTASALAHLARTCRRLHEIIASEDWRIFQAFVNSRFPNIQTPPYWKDVARALTSRSRALDQHAIIGRLVFRPASAVELGPHRVTRHDNPTHAFRPAIDSYEVWNGSSWSNRKEVLAWGAAHELRLRIRQSGTNEERTWIVFNDREHVNSHDDILGVYLLKPEHPMKTPDREHVILSRASGELAHLVISPQERTCDRKQSFHTYHSEIERTDLSEGPEPILAAHFGYGEFSFYKTTTEEANVHPFHKMELGSGVQMRHLFMKFLSPRHLAIGKGQLGDALSIYTASHERMSLTRELCTDFLDQEARKAYVSATAPLNAQFIGGSPGDAFLAAWGDGAVRLHDLRSDKPCEMTYRDSADDNPVYCIHPFGHDRFLVGAGGDAVVKIFDLRMPNNTYSHRNARAQFIPTSNGHSASIFPNKTTATNYTTRDNSRNPSKDFSFFLSCRPPSLPPSRPRSTVARYRGPIYTMSSPSNLSTTIYTGIAGGVVQLDFVSTDDLTGPYASWYSEPLDLDIERGTSRNNSEAILDLSGYERPEPNDTTTCSKLRSQQSFSSITNGGAVGVDVSEEMIGWDKRWRTFETHTRWRR